MALHWGFTGTERLNCWKGDLGTSECSLGLHGHDPTGARSHRPLCLEEPTQGQTHLKHPFSCIFLPPWMTFFLPSPPLLLLCQGEESPVLP